jgi:hypothetical protein
MERTEFCELALKYGTDKGHADDGGWGYTPHYFAKLAERRHEIECVLEIGICGFRNIKNNRVGASLFLWREAFPNAQIYGIDNDSRFIFNDEDRIHTARCDAYNSDTLADLIYNEFKLQNGTVDFIVDDCVHDPIPQINLLDDLWPLLSWDGLYALEDVCPSKLPGANLQNMTRWFPLGARYDIVDTHKPEKLLFIHN